MTASEVLKVLIKTLRSLNAVDKTWPDAKVAKIQLPEIPLLANAGDQKPLVAKDLYARVLKALTLAHPGHLKPVITPQGPKVLDRAISVGKLATEIADDTPDEAL